MRSVIFKGKFGHIKENINKGLIVFCHFEPEDNENIIIEASQKIIGMVEDKLILVPFAHLFEKSAEKEFAKKLFEKLTFECAKIKNQETIVIPFGVEKEFYLYAPAENSAIKFMKF